MPKYTRVKNKTQAKKLWRKGETVYLLPCNMALYSPWSNPMPAQKDKYVEDLNSWPNESWEDVYPDMDIIDAAWESMYNNWAYYNTDYERGYYAHYYIKE